MALIGHLRVANECRVALATLTAASSGPIPKAPGSAGGYLLALEQLPPKHQPHTQMDDIRKLLAAGCQPGTVNLHLAQAKCRLFPDLDRATIYGEYGLEDGQA